MKQLSRKKIQDMIDLNGANISSRRSSGGSGAGGGGGVSSAWVDEHYVSKDFFARLFTINGTDENDDDVVVDPNDLETTITNIQAMVGLWTEQYLSALGQGSGGGGGGGALLTEPLASINEAGMGTPSGANKVIAWNGNTWTYKPYNTGNGTVTSIRIAVPMGFSVNPSTAITTSGTFTISFARGTLGNGVVLATPSSGTGDPIWRALVADDIPGLSWTKITSDKPTTLLGYGISDAKIENGVITLGHATITPLTDAKLKNDYEWWGAKLDSTTGKREGNMSNVGNISFSASGKNIGSIAYFDTTNHRLGIGSAPGGYKLDVNGDIRTSGNLYIGGTNRILSGGGDSAKNLLEFDGTQVTLAYGFRASNETRIYGQNISMYHGTTLKVQVTSTGLKIGDATLSWDSTNHALKIDTGFYSESFISALGAGSGGGSASGITMSDVWQAMAYTAPSSSSQQIHVSHLAQALTTYATKTWVNDNFVTLVGAQSITGRKTFVSGLTTNGTTIINLGAKFYSICVECASDGTPDVNRSGEINRYNGKDLNLQYDTGTGNVTMCRNNLYFYHNSGMSYISSRNNDLQVYVGNGNPYIDKSWIVTSDERMKDIFGYVEASVKQIANAPIFNYRIKGDETEDLFLGTSAQCWQKIFPSAVREKPDGFFGFDYASAALAAAVMTARHVMTHEERIKALEKENKELRKQIETLKAS